MGHTLSVRVQDSKHRPVPGALVTITVTGLMGGKCEGLTNPAGEATITTNGDFESSREILISVRGKFRERSTIGKSVHWLTLDI